MAFLRSNPIKKSPAAGSKDLVARLTADLLEVRAHLDAAELREQQLQDATRAMYDDVQNVRDDNFALRSRLLELEPDRRSKRVAEEAAELENLREEVEQLQEQVEAGGREQKHAKKSRSWVKWRSGKREIRDREQPSVSSALSSVEEMAEMDNDGMHLRAELEEAVLQLQSESEESQQTQLALRRQLEDSEQRFQQELAQEGKQSEGLRAKLEQASQGAPQDTEHGADLYEDSDDQLECTGNDDPNDDTDEQSKAGVGMLTHHGRELPCFSETVGSGAEIAALNSQDLKQQHTELTEERLSHQKVFRELGDEQFAFRELQSRFELLESATLHADEAATQSADSDIRLLRKMNMNMAAAQDEIVRVKSELEQCRASTSDDTQLNSFAESKIAELTGVIERMRAASADELRRHESNTAASEARVSQLSTEVAQLRPAAFRADLAEGKIEQFANKFQKLQKEHDEKAKLHQVAISANADELKRHKNRTVASEARVSELTTEVAHLRLVACRADLAEGKIEQFANKLHNLQTEHDEQVQQYEAALRVAETKASQQGKEEEHSLAALRHEMKELKVSSMNDAHRGSAADKHVATLTSEIEQSQATACTLKEEVERLRQVAAGESQRRDAHDSAAEARLADMMIEVEHHNACSAQEAQRANAAESKMAGLANEVRSLQAASAEEGTQYTSSVADAKAEASELCNELQQFRQSAVTESQQRDAHKATIADLMSEVEQHRACSAHEAQLANSTESRMRDLANEAQALQAASVEEGTQYRASLADTKAEASEMSKELQQFRECDMKGSIAESRLAELMQEIEHLRSSCNEDKQGTLEAETRIANLTDEHENLQVAAAASETKASHLTLQVEQLRSTLLEESQMRDTANSASEEMIVKLRSEVDQHRECSADLARQVTSKFANEMEKLRTESDAQVKQHEVTISAAELSASKLEAAAQNRIAELKRELEQLRSSSPGVSQHDTSEQNTIVKLTSEVEQFRQSAVDESQQREAHQAKIVDLMSEVEQHRTCSTHEAQRANSVESKMHELANEVQSLQAAAVEESKQYTASITGAKTQESELSTELQQLRMRGMQENIAESKIAELMHELEHLKTSGAGDEQCTSEAKARILQLSDENENLRTTASASEAKAADLVQHVERLRHTFHEESTMQHATSRAAEETIVELKNEVNQQRICSADLARQAHAAQSKMAEFANETQQLRTETDVQLKRQKASIAAAEHKASELNAEVHQLQRAPHSVSQEGEGDVWSLLDLAKEELAAKDEEILLLRQQSSAAPSADGMGEAGKNDLVAGPAMAAKFKKDVTKFGSKLKKMDMGKLGGKFGLQNLGAKMSGGSPANVGAQSEMDISSYIDSQPDMETPGGLSTSSGNAGRPQKTSLLD